MRLMYRAGSYSLMDWNYPLKITAVIPAYNAAATLPTCLAGLIGQTFTTALQLEIILVDDGSTDCTAILATDFAAQGVRLVSIQHSGAAAARNAGVNASSSDSVAILFTDADCVPASNWAECLTKRLLAAEPQVAGIKGIYRTRQTSPVAQFVQAEYDDRYERLKKTGSLDFCDTYCAAFRREILQVYPFDESLPGAVVEDAELGWRLRNQGYQFAFEPGAVVYHQHAATLSHYFRRKFRIGRWRVDLYREYPQRLGGDSHTSQAAKLQMIWLALVIGWLGLLPSSRGWVRRWVWRGLLVSNLALQLSFGPFLARVGQRHKRLLPVAWLMLHVRTLAFTTGALWGIVRQWRRLR